MQVELTKKIDTGDAARLTTAENNSIWKLGCAHAPQSQHACVGSRCHWQWGMRGVASLAWQFHRLHRDCRRFPECLAGYSPNEAEIEFGEILRRQQLCPEWMGAFQPFNASNWPPAYCSVTTFDLY